MATKLKIKQLILTLLIVCIIVTPLLIISSHNHKMAHATTINSKDATKKFIVQVTCENLNVREKAQNSSKIINILHKGDLLNVIRTKHNWDQITLANHQTGWIKNTSVLKGSAPEKLEAVIEVPVLHVRKSPDLTSSILDELTMGTKVTIHVELNGWANIRSSSGIQGWVDERYINIISNSNHQSTTDKTSSLIGLHTIFQAIKTKLLHIHQLPLKGKTIVLDPGHGGMDDGTTSTISGTHEKTLTLATAKVVEKKLKKAGAKVMMTRTTDTFIPLEKRADISNKNHADVFISFHYNDDHAPTANGIIDFYYQKSKDDLLAEDVLNAVVKSTGLKDDGTRFNNLDVLRNNTEPCTLIELGFLSNKHDDSIVESSVYRDKVAQGVYKGLLDYFSK